MKLPPDPTLHPHLRQPIPAHHPHPAWLVACQPQRPAPPHPPPPPTLPLPRLRTSPIAYCRALGPVATPRPQLPSPPDHPTNPTPAPPLPIMKLHSL